MKHQQELTGQDRELAISEAIRSRKLTRLAVAAMIVAAAASLAGIALSLPGDVEPAQLGLYVAQLALICALAVHQIVFYRRAVAYLERFGSPPPEPGQTTGPPTVEIAPTGAEGTRFAELSIRRRKDPGVCSCCWRRSVNCDSVSW